MKYELHHTPASWLAVVRGQLPEPSGYQRLWIDTFLTLPPAADAMIRNRNPEVNGHPTVYRRATQIILEVLTPWPAT